jgi:uncharacterized lipoprotein YajG
MNIPSFIDHYREKSSSFVPFIFLLIAALILTGCASQTGTTTPVVSTLPVLESPTSASTQTKVEVSTPAAAEPPSYKLHCPGYFNPLIN